VEERYRWIKLGLGLFFLYLKIFLEDGVKKKQLNGGARYAELVRKYPGPAWWAVTLRPAFWTLESYFQSFPPPLDQQWWYYQNTAFAECHVCKHFHARYNNL
jgi:hypothetical protein